MKVSKINTYVMRNDAHFQFHTEFRGLVEKSGAAALNVGPQFAAYLPLYDKVDGALKKISKSVLTEQIQNADRARDEIWVGITEMNSAALKHFSAEVREAAKRLKILIDTYGNIAKKPLNEQTSAVYNIMQELEGKYAADAAAVGIAPWAAELKARNNAFGDQMRDRYDESALKCDTVLRDARMELDAAYRTITERIDALVVVNGTEPYEPFIRALNTVIKKYATAAAANKGRSAARKGRGNGVDGEDGENVEDVLPLSA